MIRDNLKKRNMNKPVECVFSSELEYVHHLLLDCIVSRIIWNEISSFLAGQLVLL
jgi:tRNA A37 threonylcarbamoyladenosine dehydratase